MRLDRWLVRKAALFLVCILFFCVAFLASPRVSRAETLAEDVAEAGGLFDRSDAFEPLDSVGAASESADGDGYARNALRSSLAVSPMSMSDEWLYFCKYESNQNYDQGLSYGDGYHAMGYFQFDNRYGLGDFLQAVYNYNPSKYWALKQIGDWYGWDTFGNNGDVRSVQSPGGNWTMADDLNWSWHQAYAADSTEFSQLQNGWAYEQYYLPAQSYVSSKYGLDLNSYRDCVRGMAWGMCNLFGSSGWRKWVDGANLTASMSSAQVVSCLANSLISGIEGGEYHYAYGSSYVRRYREELNDCLSFLGVDIDSLAGNNSGVLKDGRYRISTSFNRQKVLDVSGASHANGANVQLWGQNGTNAQKWDVKNVGNGYVSITNVESEKSLDVASAVKRQGINVQQYDSNGSAAQLWVPVRNADGSFTLYSALGQGLVLDIAAASTSDGANVDIYSDNATIAQTFTFTSDLDDDAAEHANDLPDGDYLISSSLLISKVVEVQWASHANGANAQLYACNSTEAQIWSVSHDSKGYVTFTNRETGKVLDVANATAANYANVQQYASNGSDAQKWVAYKQQQEDGSYTYALQSGLGNGLVLDVSGALVSNGTNLQLYSNNGTAAQRFVLIKVSGSSGLDALAAYTSKSIEDGVYRLAPAASQGMSVDVSGGSVEDGANVQIFQANSTGAQQWKVSHDESGYATFQNVGSGKSLDIQWAQAQAGANVQQFASNMSAAQKWIAVPYGTGFVLYSALGNGLVLDISGGSLSNYSNVQIYDSNETPAQVFRLIAS